MKTFLRNLFEYIFAAIILSILLPFIVNQWDTYFSRFANQQMNCLLQAVAKGESSKKIERLFSEIYSAKGNYRKISVSVPESANSSEIVRTAKQYLFTPYHLGGTCKTGVDCSGLIWLAYRKAGIQLPRTVKNQFFTGTYIPKMEQLQVGDLVFFATGKQKKPTHVGLYVGDNKMIHASSKNQRVLCVNINTSYYRQRFLGGRRVVTIN